MGLITGSHVCAILVAVILAPISAIGQPGAQTENWQRVTLTGTGMSIESPVPLKQDQEKPHPWEKSYAAHVRWSLSYGDIFATFVFEKQPDDKNSPRQRMESFASLFKKPSTSLSRVTDITFLGKTAALFEEEFTDEKTNLKMRRNMVGFGSPGEFTLVNVTFPRENASVAVTGNRIFKSVQRAGSVAAEASLYPPIKWMRIEHDGLGFDTPTQVTNPECNKLFQISTSQFEVKNVCYQWGTSVHLNVGSRKYTAIAPSPRTEAEDYLKRSKEIDKDFTSTKLSEYTISAFAINGGEAVKLRHFESLGTVGTVEEIIFIRRGQYLWRASIYNFIERKADELAKRILGSFSFGRPDSTVGTLLQTPPSAAAAYLASGKSFAANGNHERAVTAFTEGLKLEPKNANLHFQRALSLEKLGRVDEAIRDYNAIILLSALLREARYNRGTLYLNRRSYALAIVDFNQAILIDPKYEAAHYNRGLGKYNLKQVDAALVDFNRVVELRPKHISARIMRARIYCSKGLLMSALKEQDAVRQLGGTIISGCR